MRVPSADARQQQHHRTRASKSAVGCLIRHWRETKALRPCAAFCITDGEGAGIDTLGDGNRPALDSIRA